jgi:ferredoxin
MTNKSSSTIDIFDMLNESGEKVENSKKKTAQNTQREELLEATCVKDLFPEGSISINKYTCTGVQCKLCIKACPTNALYWTSNGIGITEDLCVHCEACVLSCMVDNCIKITRKTESGKEEHFSTTKEVISLENKKNAQKRLQRICDVFPTNEDYCKRYNHLK